MRAKKDRQPEYSRDKLLEARYHFDRRGENSVLAFVISYRDELVQAFKAWREVHRDGEHWGAVIRWEVERFGAELYPAAHGVMATAIRGRK